MLRMTNEQLIERSNRLRNLMGGYDLPDGVAKEIIKQTKVAKKRVNKPKEVVPSEHEEQVKVIEWCDAHPVAKHIFAIPNGSHKSPFRANKFKAEGLRSGVPDLFLPGALGGCAGLFIEMKRQPKAGGTTSETQRAWANFLQKEYACYVARGAEQAIAIIEKYLSGNG